MEVTVKRLTDWSEVLNDARFTVGKEETGKEPSDKFKCNILTAEHSPIRTLIYVVTIKDVPTWVSQHIARHDAFAGHNVREGASDTHFVATQRTDRTGVDRSEKKQTDPVSHRILLNAQDLITISRHRLCSCASKETREVWEEVKRKVAEIDPHVAEHMVRECIYRGFCPEGDRICGYSRTEKYRKELENYRNSWRHGEET